MKPNLATALAFIAACALTSIAHAAGSITVQSSRPDMVSGGDALISISGPGSISLNGANITAAFKTLPGGKRIGLIGGLKPGANTLKAGAANLTLTNHSIAGPLFSGPRETPYYCMTDAFKLPASAETLGAPLDANCSVKTRADYVYRTKGGAFKPLPGGPAPDDLATTKTTDGKTVPYIVRVETGTVDRAIYQTAILADPSTAIGPTAPPPAWNRKLVYTFGGGCVGGWYIQGSKISDRGVLEDLMLRQGYAIASSSLNVFGANCAPTLAAEAVEMVKERFIKTYGLPQFTIGWGCSGGSEQLHPIGDAYPGLVDGFIVGCSFPDVIGAMVLNVGDADLLAHYFKTAKLPWSDAQKAAAAGYPNATTAETIGPLAVRIKAEGGTCEAAVPKEVRFSRADNPKGVRCDIYDHTINAFGKDPKTGSARRTWDNVGVQYGLEALKSGAISAAQFLDLNRAVGSFDRDGAYVAGRTAADPIGLKNAYQTGQITYGGLGLKSTPIIDYRGYVDAPENSNENHSRFHSFSLRARLEKVNGSAANHVMIVESGFLRPGGAGLFNDDSPVLGHALTQMDQWLSNLQPGAGARPTLDAIAKAKPADLVDACFKDDGTKIAEPQMFRGDTACNRLFPAYASPRLVAGEPLTNDVLKCQLKPIDPADYGGKLSADDLADLKRQFPRGVCDFSKPGVGQTPTRGTWLSLAAPAKARKAKAG